MSAKRMLAEALLDAETKIGELLREAEPVSLRDDSGRITGWEGKLPSGITRNQSSQFQKMAERRCGELLRKQDKNPGTQGQLRGKPRLGGDIGISKKQSSRW